MGHVARSLQQDPAMDLLGGGLDLEMRLPCLINPPGAFGLVQLHTDIPDHGQFREAKLGVNPLLDLLAHRPAGEKEMLQAVALLCIEPHDAIIPKSVLGLHIATLVIRVLQNLLEFLDADSFLV
jgi:hypothetical protein